MRVTLLNGEPEADTPFDRAVDAFVARLRDADHTVTCLQLRELSIRGCNGCWGCWVRTPGECVKRDDTADIRRSVIHSELTVFAAPMVMGFTSALLKRATDQLIPLLHPYVLVEGGEMHHRPRYARYPLLALLLGPAPDTDAEDLAITTKMWSRTARNMKTRLAFTAIAGRNEQEVVDAIARAA